MDGYIRTELEKWPMKERKSGSLGRGTDQEKMESNGFVDEIAEIVKPGSRRLFEENNSKTSSPNQKELSIISSQAPSIIGSDKSAMESNSKPVSSNQRNSIAVNQEDQLESAKSEMGEVREENERLKMILARIVKDYQSLQMHFFDIVQQEHANKPTELATIDQEMEEPELVSLSLGTTASGQKKGDTISNLSKGKCREQLNEGLSLGLDCKFEGIESSRNQSPENSFEESKEEEITEAWVPQSKVMKTRRSGEDEVSQQSNVKKARVSVRARCDAPTMIDGCQWRKYGQKISKGNPCPRAYYRCTVAPACPVRKQVQRCVEDMSILITTYEGTHNHPLPISAMDMASTTSAAAYMLVSGSSASRSPTATSPVDPHGLNFNPTDTSRSKPFLLPNPSISSSLAYPTITLDLTSPSPSSSSSQFSRFPSNFSHNPRYPSTNFNFCSDPNSSQSPWCNGYLTYGSQNHKKSPIGTSNFVRISQEQIYQPYLQNPGFAPPQQSLTETVTAATKAITSDPNFRSALATAITSIVSGGGNLKVQGNGSSVDMETVLQNLKWAEKFSTIASYSSSANGNACGSSYLNMGSSSSNS